MGRIETTYKGPRVIDLDILLYENQILNHENLKIPHAGLLERDFVLKPLMDIDPNLIIPIKNMPLKQIYEEYLKNPNYQKSDPRKVFAFSKGNEKEIVFDFNKKTYSMGIYNITNDSICNPWLKMNDFIKKEDVYGKILFDIKQNLNIFDIFDIGGESTRPSASEISSEEEISRILPLIRAINENKEFSKIIISLDTRKVYKSYINFYKLLFISPMSFEK